MVQVLLSPRAIVPEQPADALAAYPAAGASVTEYAPTEVRVFATPGDSAPANELPPTATTPLIVSVKSAATFVPTWLLITCFTTVSVAAWSSFVRMQILCSPAAIVPLQPAEALPAYPATGASVTL